MFCIALILLYHEKFLNIITHTKATDITVIFDRYYVFATVTYPGVSDGQKFIFVFKF